VDLVAIALRQQLLSAWMSRMIPAAVAILAMHFMHCRCRSHRTSCGVESISIPIPSPEIRPQARGD
jgi:hypothetical protein